MSIFSIYGGQPLRGSIRPQGSKNEAFQVICATLLTSAPVTIHNIPAILDIQELLSLLQVLGVAIEKLDKNSYRFQAANLHTGPGYIRELKEHASKIRGSILILGPLLARLGKAQILQPGGDRIGRRRLDTHFRGISKLGASFKYDAQLGAYLVVAKQLKGSYILLDEASVTGTANLIMAASLAQGITTIYNAACEPHVQQLCKMLVQMGANIEGIGSNLLTIHGVEELQGTTHRILPDMLEVGSFISLAAMTRAELTIQDVHAKQLEPILERFKQLGIQLDITDDDIHIHPQACYEIEKDINSSMLTLADAAWPGLPADLLSIMLVTAIQAKGSVLVHQKMYESRLFFVDKLLEMGAQLVLCDPHRVNVIGLNQAYPLRGIRMTSPDIRAGIALLIAALSAEGKSIIEHILQIDRGYEKIEERLKLLGADIERIA
ncbi:MAG: UDP-N-acetylglucosamine 1-carboxyvinyltransferase [Bacteroidota bacterium]